MRIILALTIAALIISGCSTTGEKSANRPTVARMDIDRYLGTWYEIARFDHRFERDLVGVTATYELRSDGRIDVLNAGFKGSLDGKRKTARGVARIPDSARPGRLQVTFFLWFWADYLILELDAENYQYALVGSAGDDYLWILSRSPQMDDATYQMLLHRARELGYDISRLIEVPHRG